VFNKSLVRALQVAYESVSRRLVRRGPPSLT